jgi:hypothetical protein
MGAYREDRRIDAIRALSTVTKNEAGTLSDVVREDRWVRAREAIADEQRQAKTPQKRRFADLVKPKTR